jgi:hypothetical protein
MTKIQVPSAEVYRTRRGLGEVDPIIDAAGNTFIAVREITGNDTDAYIRKHAPNGALVGEWEVQGANGWKIDGCALGASGDHLIVATASHDLTPNPEGRWSAAGLAHIPGVFVPFTGQLPEGGAAGAFTPVETEVEVDYNLIRGIVKQEVQAIIGADERNSLVNRFSHGDDVRGQIRIVDKQASTYLIDRANYNDPTDPDHLARKFQDGLFEQVKNANAGVQANILGGVDAWGVARRDELKAIIREVIEEVNASEESEA